MNNLWNEAKREREFQHYARNNHNRFENQQYNSGFENSNYPRFSQDRSRTRNSYNAVSSFTNDNNFYNANRSYRGRNWERRSSSAPRTNAAEDKGRWNSNWSKNRGRKNSANNYSNNGKTEGEVKTNERGPEEDKSTQPTQMTKFRSIFSTDSVAPAVQNDDSNPVININNDMSKVLKTTDINDQINHIVTSINLNKSTESLDTSDKTCNIQNINPKSVELPPAKVRKVFLKSPIEGDLSKYFGESITDLKREGLVIQDTNLPVVDWSKRSFSLDNIPEYDSNTSVGGEGLTLEVYYMCKYCKMFTGGGQIEAHLKSRYHYDKYKTFLKTGQVQSSDSSSGSSQSSEANSKTSKSPMKNFHTQPSAMDIDDPSELFYKCYQVLDYD